MKCVNIKLWDILGCFNYILNAPRNSHYKKIGFQDQLPLNSGKKYCRMLQWEHSAIHYTCILLPFVIMIFVLSIFEWPLKTCFTGAYVVEIKQDTIN